MSADFIDLLIRLAENEVEFVLIGGFAGVVYGCTYVTQDIDICCDFSTDNLKKLYTAIKDVKPVHRMTPKRLKFKLSDTQSGSLKNLYLDTDIGQLDCLGSVAGLGDFNKVKEASRLVKVERTIFRVLDLDALIEAKKAMNRPRDREALIQLEKIKKSPPKKSR